MYIYISLKAGQASELPPLTLLPPLTIATPSYLATAPYHWQALGEFFGPRLPIRMLDPLKRQHAQQARLRSS